MMFLHSHEHTYTPKQTSKSQNSVRSVPSSTTGEQIKFCSFYPSLLGVYMCVFSCVHPTAWGFLKDSVNSHCAAFSHKIKVVLHMKLQTTTHTLIIYLKQQQQCNNTLLFLVPHIYSAAFRVTIVFLYDLYQSVLESMTTNLSRSAISPITPLVNLS